MTTQEVKNNETEELSLKLINVEALICSKSISGRVLYQNSACEKVCGIRTALVCTDGCMKLTAPSRTQSIPLEGIELYKGQKLFEDPRTFDIAIIKNNTQMITLALPLDDRIEVVEQAKRKCHLTHRETEIMEKILAKKTRQEILLELGISKATLKTHINHLYKKLPKELQNQLRSR